MNSRRFVVIVNPHGGKRRGLMVLEQVKPIMVGAGADLDIRVTQAAGQAGEIARSLDLGSYDGICVIGGDGTVHEVADGLMQRGESIPIPLGVIPGGSGNSLHQHLQCHDPLEAARRIVASHDQPLDVVRVVLEDRVVFCIDIVGWGAVADINITAEKLRVLGPRRYALSALWHILRAKRRPAKLLLDGQTVDDKFSFIIACNPKFTGLNMKLAPHAEIGDGKVDIVVVRRASRWQMLKLFAKVFDGTHVSLPCVEYHQVRSFAIESAGNEPLDLDGEMKGNLPLSAEVLPGALRVFA